MLDFVKSSVSFVCIFILTPSSNYIRYSFVKYRPKSKFIRNILKNYQYPLNIGFRFENLQWNITFTKIITLRMEWENIAFQYWCSKEKCIHSNIPMAIYTANIASTVQYITISNKIVLLLFWLEENFLEKPVILTGDRVLWRSACTR